MTNPKDMTTKQIKEWLTSKGLLYSIADSDDVYIKYLHEIALHCVNEMETCRASSGIDKCIQPLIDALNKNNNKTIASCCGHDNQPPSVILEDGTEIRILSREQSKRISELFPSAHKEHPLYGEKSAYDKVIELQAELETKNAVIVELEAGNLCS